jgi:hypothetical protein
LSLRALLLAACLCGCAAASHAGPASLQFCDRSMPKTARQQDRVLRFAALVKRELDESGQDVALISRSGVDLHRFGVRYSHAGVSLKANGDALWSVRQLYYACDEGRPRLYDQGLAGFLLGDDDATLGYVSIVLLPSAEAAELEAAALDNARALHLLAATYSANAYPFSLRYQNCNQWVMELLATAWGALDDAQERPEDLPEDLRQRAQQWLMKRGYEPPPVDVGSHLLMFAAQFVPLIHLDDHPQDDRFALHFRTSLPASIEAFVHERVAGARRIEMCRDGQRVVIHPGWEPVAQGCRPAAGDRVIALD